MSKLDIDRVQIGHVGADRTYLRVLADWHNRQARYVLLAVTAGQHDQGRFHSPLSRLADKATMNRTKLLVDE